VKRLVNQADSRIEEHVLSIGEKDKKFVVVMEVAGSKFKSAGGSLGSTASAALSRLRPQVGRSALVRDACCSSRID
jgi:hypothetical protein